MQEYGWKQKKYFVGTKYVELVTALNISYAELGRRVGRTRGQICNIFAYGIARKSTVQKIEKRIELIADEYSVAINNFKQNKSGSI